MRPRKTAPVEYLRRLFAYDPVTGELTRRTRAGKMAAGSSAYRLDHGRYVVKVAEFGVFASTRVIWLVHFGAAPTRDVDHINGDPTDNRLCNLRDVPTHINTQNRRTASKNSRTGVLGVSPSSRYPGWFRADIHTGGRQKALGHFSTMEEAQQVYVQAKREMHPGCTL
jgi:hypothetical protein